MVAFRDGPCGNDDATPVSIAGSYVLIYVLAVGVRLEVLMVRRLLFELAQLRSLLL